MRVVQNQMMEYYFQTMNLDNRLQVSCEMNQIQVRLMTMDRNQMSLIAQIYILIRVI